MCACKFIHTKNYPQGKRDMVSIRVSARNGVKVSIGVRVTYGYG